MKAASRRVVPNSTWPSLADRLPLAPAIKYFAVDVLIVVVLFALLSGLAEFKPR